MNYHFFCWDDKFVDSFIQFADETTSNNVFVYYFSQPTRHVKSKRGIFAPANSPELEDVLRKISADDKVFMHPLIETDIFSKIPEETKVYAIFWGAEFLNINIRCGVDNAFGDLLYEPVTKRYMRLYSNIYRVGHLVRFIIKNIKGGNFEDFLKLLLLPREYNDYFDRNLADFIHERKRLLKRLTAVCHWNDLDIVLLQDLFDEKINCRKFFYGIGRYMMNPDAIYTSSKEMSETLNFFVGNSDTPTNNHLDTFNLLKRFRRENIMIYAPLSYHVGKYAKYIARIGRWLFGDKFTPILDFLPREQYLAMMDSMDVCVMNHRRTQAGGNVSAFIAKGKKVFLNPNSTLYWFYKNLGVEVFSTQLLKSLSLDELRAPLDISVAKRNVEILRNHFGSEAAVKTYRDLFT